MVLSWGRPARVMEPRYAPLPTLGAEPERGIVQRLAGPGVVPAREVERLPLVVLEPLEDVALVEGLGGEADLGRAPRRIGLDQVAVGADQDRPAESLGEDEWLQAALTAGEGADEAPKRVEDPAGLGHQVGADPELVAAERAVADDRVDESAPRRRGNLLYLGFAGALSPAHDGGLLLAEGVVPCLEELPWRGGGRTGQHPSGRRRAQDRRRLVGEAEREVRDGVVELIPDVDGEEGG